MTQVALSDQIFERLRLVASKRHTSVSTLLEKIVEAYLVQDEYNEADDPAINLLYGPTDLSTRAKSILREEITSTSGWTQKPTDL
ncbi:MAG: hypothetical protein R3E79_06385 [Caldilineaceae bacterium]